MSGLKVGLLVGLVVGGVFAQEAPNAIYEEAMELLAEGRQKDAEERVEAACTTNSGDQRLLFLKGVMERSRFRKADAFRTMSGVYALGSETVLGQAALASVSMDFDLGIEAGLGALGSLIETHPAEILLRWLFAIQCRTHRRYSEEAAKQYLVILDEWNPGPVMVNHTYANILTESLGRPEEALVYRERALALAQRGWTYQGYANTLRKLGRYEEASEAFKKAVQLAPDRVAYWSQWGNCLVDSGQLKKAYKVFRGAYDAGLREVEILVGLGRANELGRGTPKNDLQALGWYKRAAAAGSGEAMYRLGRMREDGRGESKDYVAAAEWYQKAIDADYDRPLPDLARLYKNGGYGLDRDLKKVEALFGKFPRSSSTGAGASRTTRFVGLAFARVNAQNHQSMVLDYGGTCSALRGKMALGDDMAKDLLAWLYSIHPNPDPQLKGAAVRLAKGLYRKDEKNPQWRNTLAAAYAREGRFEQAVRQQKKAIQLLSSKRKNTEEGRAYMERLKLYESEWPYTAYCGVNFMVPTGSRPSSPPSEAFRKAGAFERGEGGEKDYEKALEFYRKAAEEGDNSAAQICKIYQRGGFGVDRNLKRAAESYAKWAGARPISKNVQYMGGHKLILSYSNTSGEEVDIRVEYEMTISTCKEAMELGDEESTELLAWIYATCEVPRYRNGGEAVRLAEKLCEKDGQNPQWKNTLAAAYARVGKYDSAVEQQEMAIALLSEKRQASPEGRAYFDRLERYRQGQRFSAGE